MNIRQQFLQHQAQTTHFPVMLEISHAAGNYLIDVNGKRYLDLISGISVSHLGHGNTRVKQAITAQLDRHQHVMVYGEFIQSEQAGLSQDITDLLPPTLNSVYLLNSGAEATDVAMKLVKRVSGRSGIVACFNAYHGSTHAALSLNSQEYYKQAFRPLLPGISFIQFNQPDNLSAISTQTAAVFCEVIQGEAGYEPASIEFLKALRERCNATGALLVFDEIQSGMGKTGKMFAFEHYNIVPDVLLLGKALGAGMPIGAVVSSRHHMQKLADNPILGHITTFGGHPVVAAAARAGIAALKESEYIEKVAAHEALFRALLVHPRIRKVSGKGLMLAIELEDFDHTLRLVNYCITQGLITDWFLFANNRLRIAPPLSITEEEIRWACNVIITGLNQAD